VILGGMLAGTIVSVITGGGNDLFNSTMAFTTVILGIYTAWITLWGITRVGYDYTRRNTLRMGRLVTYRAGRWNNHIVARVKVTQQPGTTGCYVNIEKIFWRGKGCEEKVGDTILAGLSELHIL